MFDKSLLPSPRTFYEAAIGKLTRPNSKGWSLGNCPFHKSKSRKAFGANLNTGSFCCHGCGRKGDLISFVMQLEGVTFKQACERLGTRQEKGNPRRKGRAARAPVRYLVMDFIIDGTEYRGEVLDEPKTERERLRRFHAEAADRLGEIHRGNSEKFEGEAEVQWRILADSWELIRLEAADGQ
jgi:DNA primase